MDALELKKCLLSSCVYQHSWFVATLLIYNSEHKIYTFEVYNPVVYTTFTRLQCYYHYLIPDYFNPSKKTPILFNKSFFYFPPQPQATILYFVSGLVCSGHMYKCDLL